MSIAPFLQPFIEISHQLKEDRQVSASFVEVEQPILYVGVWGCGVGYGAFSHLRWNRDPVMLQKVIEVIDYGSLGQSFLSGPDSCCAVR